VQTSKSRRVQADASAASTIQNDLGWLFEKLTSEEETVARLIAEASRGEVKEYETLARPEQVSEVVEDTRRHLQTFARCAPTGRMPELDELNFIADLARFRASGGFPLEAMLQAFRVGHRVLWDWLVAQVDDSRKGSVALGITPFMHEYLGVVTRRLTETYVEAVQTYVADVDKSHRDVFEALLRGDDPARARTLARGFGLAWEVQYVVVVAMVEEPVPGRENELRRRSGEVLGRRLLEAGMEAFPILRDEEVVLLVPWTPDRRRALHQAVEAATASLAQLYGARLVIGASMVCFGLVEIGRGYPEACQAVERARVTDGFVALADTSLYESLLALGAASIQRRLPAWATTLLEEGSRSDLIDTLQAYLAADLSIERAARALFVHPNTIRYRLRRLSQLTGLDVSSFYDLVELVTAIRLLPVAQTQRSDPRGPSSTNGR
jgi:hypothetical protein